MGGKDHPVMLNAKLNGIAEPALFDHRLRNADSARIANADQLYPHIHLGDYIVLTWLPDDKPRALERL